MSPRNNNRFFIKVLKKGNPEHDSWIPDDSSFNVAENIYDGAYDFVSDWGAHALGAVGRLAPTLKIQPTKR